MSDSAERPIGDERIVITGATNGIGRELARGLARRGALLTLVARNPAKAEATADELAAEPGASSRPDIVIGDLGDLGSVLLAAAFIALRHDRIGTLINNAGVTLPIAQTSPDGFDLMMATNHLGPFLFTNLLLETLKASAPARIVITGSEAHRMCVRPDLATLGAPKHYSVAGAQNRYGQSKLMNLLFAAELGERLDDTSVTTNAFCPGLVSTGLVGDRPALSRVLDTIARTPLMRRPEQGAAMGLRLVLDPALVDVTGQFFTSTPGAGLLPTARSRRDRDYQRAAWERTTELVGLAD
jgi:NAD(P)-dependent dehydrogenase (short-subunit alcohol dehydrogenase family)